MPSIFETLFFNLAQFCHPDITSTYIISFEYVDFWPKLVLILDIPSLSEKTTSYISLILFTISFYLRSKIEGHILMEQE